MVSDDETDQDATKDAFEVLGVIVGKRLARGRLTVVDATNAQRDARRHVIELARAHDVLPVAIVLDLPEAVCLGAQRGPRRPDAAGARGEAAGRPGAPGRARPAARGVPAGARAAHAEEVEEAVLRRTPLRNDLRDDARPVRRDRRRARLPVGAGAAARACWATCCDRDAEGRPVDAVHPDGRTVVFLGDLVDRGPDSPGVLRLAMGMHAAGHALVVPGNHENKLVRALDGRDVTVSHGLETTLAQLSTGDPEFRPRSATGSTAWSRHLVLDDGRLVVAHAGLKEAYHGRTSGRVRSFALYGDTTGETDEFGLPVRYPWADEYRGAAMVLYGHTPTPVPQWVNNTMCLDTGCVFGGHLTALRYPTKELVQVPAEQVWYEPAKPFRTAPTPPGRPPGHPGRARASVGGDAAPRPRHDRRAERRRRARGDEPVRAAPALGAVPAADDGAGGHLAAARPPRAPGRGVLGVPGGGRLARDLRGEAHGLAGVGARVSRRGDGDPPVRRARR